MKTALPVARSRSVLCLAVSAVLVFSQIAVAQEFSDNWPNFRGPTYNGTSTTATIPFESGVSKDKMIRYNQL